MLFGRLTIVSAALLALMPGAALARAPRTVARTGRLDFGPVLTAGRVAYAAAPHLRLVAPTGHVTNVKGIDSPIATQPARAHAATPEGTLSFQSDLLSFASDAVAWQDVSDRVDPSFDEFRSSNAYFRSPLTKGTSQSLGGWDSEGPQGGTVVCMQPQPQPQRDLAELGLSDQALAYVANEPPAECPQPGVPTKARLIARTVSHGVLGPEQVLAEAAPAGLHVAGPYVAWLAPGADSRFTATVVDVTAGAVVYEVGGLAPKAIALAADGTLAIGQQDGTLSWASPSEPSLHPAGFGSPLAAAGGTILAEASHALRLQALDGSSRRLARFGRNQWRAGAADFDGSLATWAVRRKVCKRRHPHRCHWAYSIRLERVD